MSDDKLYWVFFAEKAPLLRNLKPYAKSSDSDLNEVLNRYWKNYAGQVKKYNHFEALRSAQLIRSLDTTGYRASLKRAKDAKSEYKIHPQYQYIKEMRDILLHDPLFVQQHLDDMYVILEAGMNKLTPDQNMKLAKRAYWDTFMNDKAQDVSSSIEQIFEELDLPVIMSDFENHAYNRFQKTLTSMKTIFQTPNVLPQWSQLSEEERQPYYQEARLCVIAHRAYTLFWNDARNGYMHNFDETNPDKRMLRKVWNELGVESRLVYFDKAKENVLTDTVNGRNQMAELYRKDEEKISDPTGLEFVYPREILEFKNNGFGVFVNHKRPELLKEPGMKEKQYFYVNLILRDRWNTLSIEECQEYETIANNIKKAEEDAVKKEAPKPVVPKKTESPPSKPDKRVCASKFLPDEADYAAFRLYSQTTKEASSTELSKSELWQKWIELSEQEQETYYSQVMSDQAFLFYKKDFARVKLQKDMSNIVEYEVEQAELKKTWDGLAVESREPYIKKLQDSKSSKERKSKYPYNSIPAMDILNSRFKWLYPTIITTDIDEDQKALIAYMEKQRPELLKEPGMDKKRHFQLNLILQQRWNALCVTKREEYNQIVQRIMLIHKELEAFDRDAKKTLKSLTCRDNYFIDMMARNRVSILSRFDDVDEYYAYMPDGKNRSNINYKIPSNDKIVAPKPWHSDIACFTDKTDREAFSMFKKTVQSMTDTLLWNDFTLWPLFIQLDKAQIDSYYETVQKTKTESKARLLYAKANVVAMQPLENNCNYIKKLHELHHEWEQLHETIKNSYLEMANKALEEEAKQKERITTTMHDPYSYLEPIYKIPYDHDHDRKAFAVFMQWDRMNYGNKTFYKNKHYFEVSYKMKNLFYNLSESTSKLIDNIIQRTTEIQQKLKECRPDVWSVFEAENINKSLTWDKVSDEQKAIYCQKTLAKRQQLMNEISDLEEYFVWTACKTKPIYPNVSKFTTQDPVLNLVYQNLAKCQRENSVLMSGKKMDEYDQKIRDEIRKAWPKPMTTSTDASNPSTKPAAEAIVNQRPDLMALFPFANRLNISLKEQQEIAEKAAELERSLKVKQFHELNAKSKADLAEKKRNTDTELAKLAAEISKLAPKFTVAVPPQDSTTLRQLEIVKDREDRKRIENLCTKAANTTISTTPKDYISEYMWLLDDADMQAFRQYVDSVPSKSTDAPLNREVLWNSFKQLSDSELNNYYKSFDKTRSNVAGTVTTVDDMDAILEPIYSKKIIGHADIETKAFIVYCEKMRPQLLLEPGMAWKRSFQLNLILAQRFEKLNKKELNDYRYAAERINQIQKKLNTTPVTAYANFVADSIVKNRSSETWESLSEATKTCYEGKAKINRQMLHLLYHDLGEYFQWTNRSKSVEGQKSEVVKKVSKITIPTTAEFLGLDVDKTTSKIVVRAENSTPNTSLSIPKVLENDNSLFGKSLATTTPNAAVNTNAIPSKTPESKNSTKPAFEFHYRESTSANTEESLLPGVPNSNTQNPAPIKTATSEKLETPATKTNQEPVIPKLFKYQKSHFELAYMNENVFHQRRTPWITHDYMLYTNPVDNAAFEIFANLAHKKYPNYSGNKMFKKFTMLKLEKREFYYQCAFQTAAKDDAEILFILEKQTSENGSKECAAERRQLEIQWRLMSTKERQVYRNKTFNNFLKDDKNPEKRFVKWEAYRDSFIPRAVSIDNVDAKLVAIPPFNHITTNSDSCAFFLYMEKMRPELVKQPGVVQKRYYEVSFLLKDQWIALSKEEQQPYFDNVHRFLHIRKRLHEWKLSAKEVYTQNRRGRVPFDNLDAESQKRYCEVALQNRMILLKKYPDLHEYYMWITPKPKAEPSELAKLFTSDAKNGESIKKESEDESENSPNAHFNYYHYADSLDLAAFEEYRKNLQTMTSKYMGFNAWWQEFVNLTEEERNVYYDKSFNDNCMKKARASFASEFGSETCKSLKDEAYGKEIAQLYRTWESLSAPAKQYYIDIKKETLIKRENNRQLWPKESHYEFGKYSESAPGCCFMVKAVYQLRGTSNAAILYKNHHQEELLKEPGMAKLRSFQFAMIAEQRFKSLSDEERQPYLDVVARMQKICKYLQKYPISDYHVYSKQCNFIAQLQKNGKYVSWDKIPDDDKARYAEEAKQNLANLSKKFPDIGEYYHWVVNDGKSEKLTSNTITFVPKELLVENEDTEEATTEANSSGTWEVVNDDTNEEKEIQTSLATDAEPPTAVIPETIPQKDESLEPQVESTVNADTSGDSESESNWEVVTDDANVQMEEETTPATETESTTAVVPDVVLPEDISSESRSVEPIIDGNTSEDSESENSWEVVDDEDDGL